MHRPLKQQFGWEEPRPALGEEGGWTIEGGKEAYEKALSQFNAQNMNTYECNDLLANLLNELRENQRAFFRSQPGSLAKAEALKRAKTLEKELDQFLEMRNRDKLTAHSQPTLF